MFNITPVCVRCKAKSNRGTPAWLLTTLPSLLPAGRYCGQWGEGEEDELQRWALMGSLFTLASSIQALEGPSFTSSGQCTKAFGGEDVGGDAGWKHVLSLVALLHDGKRWAGLEAFWSSCAQENYIEVCNKGRGGFCSRHTGLSGSAGLIYKWWRKLLVFVHSSLLRTQGPNPGMRADCEVLSMSWVAAHSCLRDGLLLKSPFGLFQASSASFIKWGSMDALDVCPWLQSPHQADFQGLDRTTCLEKWALCHLRPSTMANFFSNLSLWGREKKSWCPVQRIYFPVPTIRMVWPLGGSPPWWWEIGSAVWCPQALLFFAAEFLPHLVGNVPSSLLSIYFGGGEVTEAVHLQALGWWFSMMAGDSRPWGLLEILHT